MNRHSLGSFSLWPLNLSSSSVALDFPGCTYMYIALNLVMVSFRDLSCDKGKGRGLVKVGTFFRPEKGIWTFESNLCQNISLSISGPCSQFGLKYCDFSFCDVIRLSWRVQFSVSAGSPGCGSGMGLRHKTETALWRIPTKWTSRWYIFSTCI